MIQPVIGMPGITATNRSPHGIVFRQVGFDGNLAGGKVIDGSKTRDPGNGSTPQFLRPGLLMGRTTATKKYRNAVIGVSNLAYADNDSTIQTDLATATEIARLKALGGGGNLSLNF